MKHAIALGAAALALAGCAGSEDGGASLYFGQAITLGVSIGATAGAAGSPELAVGFRQANIAVVPAVMSNKHPRNPGNAYQPQVTAFGTGDDSRSDALSTFGSFNNENTTGSVNLGVFFATGVAAQHLAQGVGCGIAAETGGACPQ